MYGSTGLFTTLLNPPPRSVKGSLSDSDVHPSVCLSVYHQHRLASGRGRRCSGHAVSHDATIYCYGRALIVSTYLGDTVVGIVLTK